ncbi:MAG TPA: hypothetical protein VJP02_01180 [Candidatus Sulfotelmatobacter sp.]|nr:hypothetical protein [Candidatus Sulfotelmatobacter sp.]
MANNDEGKVTEMELTRLKYGHVENMIALAIVALITVGGFACILYGQPCGQTIIIAVMSFVGGWLGAKRLNRSGRT